MEITIQGKSSYTGSNQQMDSGLAWSVLLSKPIFVITVVKMLLTHDAQLSKSATNFDHCDDKYCF